MLKFKEALYYKKLKDEKIQCQLCPRLCIIKNGNKGVCLARKNVNGKLNSLVYEKPCTVHVDKIEKKPLYHFLPGTYTYSIGTFGCQLICSFCQNWEIARADPEEFNLKKIKPKSIVDGALKNKCKSIAYTYNDPTVFYEYVLDIAKLAKKKDLKNIIVCNGYINKKPLIELCKYLDAANIDLKSFNEKFYKEITTASLKPVLNSLKILKENNVWLEITNLVIPKKNDNVKEIKEMCSWIKNNLGANMPLHFSRFFPMYKMLNIQPTPEKTLLEAKKIALENGLRYVYIGNIDIENAENTYCPKCGKSLIKRAGFEVINNNIENGKCSCGEKIPGIWS